MSIQSLPCELARAVIECIPSKKDISSISLASTNLLALARPILFSSIRLPRFPEDRIPFAPIPTDLAGTMVRSPKGGGERASTIDEDPLDYRVFVAFLASAPHLSILIRHLTFWNTCSVFVPHDGELYRLFGGKLTFELFDELLAHLPNLQTLWLHDIDFALPETQTSAPRRYDSLDRLTISHAGRLWDVKTPLSLFSRIRELSLLFCWGWSHSTGSFDQELPEDLQITSLALNGYRQELEIWTEMLKPTSTLKILQSLSVHYPLFTNHCYPSSTLIDFLREAAPTLAHITLGTTYAGLLESCESDQTAYMQFDSAEMRARLAPLTSLRSLVLKFQVFYPDASGSEYNYLSQTFARMVPILASFPSCLRRITFSFANPEPVLVDRPDLLPKSPSWLWQDLDLRLLVPLLRQYKQLEAVVFEGADGTKAEEQERILNDLPEFKGLIRFIV